jgi:shikimate dehydrogenase
MSNITGKARVAGVIGWPVTHSLSPALHNYWLAAHNIDGVYIPLSVNPAHLTEIMPSLPLMGFRGVNLTLPHKELVLPLLDSADAEATAIGAVNTVIVTAEGKLHGTNTDAYGFIENIRPALAKKNKAVVLGAGGAAKAVIYALRQEGFAHIIVTNRTRHKAEVLAASFSGVSMEGWENRASALTGADLLVNATSLGMTGKAPLDISLDTLPETALVTDLVYAPLLTPLLVAAQSRGNPVVDGLGMLIHQAVPAFEAWFGSKPEVTPGLRAHLMAVCA